MSRIAGIDYGEARIGLALSDPNKILASPLKTLKAKAALPETATYLAEEFRKIASLEKIVIGLPLFMNGKDSPSSQKVRLLASLLEGLLQMPVILWDERLSTTQAERALKEANFNRKKRKEKVDAIAAILILQSFLDSPFNTK